MNLNTSSEAGAGAWSILGQLPSPGFKAMRELNSRLRVTGIGLISSDCVADHCWPRLSFFTGEGLMSLQVLESIIAITKDVLKHTQKLVICKHIYEHTRVKSLTNALFKVAGGASKDRTSCCGILERIQVSEVGSILS